MEAERAGFIYQIVVTYFRRLRTAPTREEDWPDGLRNRFLRT